MDLRHSLLHAGELRKNVASMTLKAINAKPTPFVLHVFVHAASQMQCDATSAVHIALATLRT
jgi:hypothetical protein